MTPAGVEPATFRSVCRLSPDSSIRHAVRRVLQQARYVFSWSIFTLWNAALNIQVRTETLCASSCVLHVVYPTVLHNSCRWQTAPTKDRQDILYLFSRRHCIRPSLFLVLCYRLLWISVCQNYRRMLCRVVRKSVDLYCTTSRRDASGRTNRIPHFCASSKHSHLEMRHPRCVGSITKNFV